ncbi:MAG: hypothetical protein WCI05_08725 [Myxococcales bacterium]
MASIVRLSRAEKRDLAIALRDNLIERQAAHGPEPVLDSFVPELDGVATTLLETVHGKVTARGAKMTEQMDADVADDDVDTDLRHFVGYLIAESLRRYGPRGPAAGALLAAAFPDRLEHINDRILDENRFCRESIKVLRDPVHAATLVLVELPLTWVDRFEAHVDLSDEKALTVEKARASAKSAVGLGLDAEADAVDVIGRLHKAVGSRTKRNDVAKREEGKLLLAPLFKALADLGALDASRATKRETKKAAMTPSGPKIEPDQPVKAP